MTDCTSDGTFHLGVLLQLNEVGNLNTEVDTDTAYVLVFGFAMSNRFMDPVADTLTILDGGNLNAVVNAKVLSGLVACAVISLAPVAGILTT